VQTDSFATELLPPSHNHLSAAAVRVLSNCHFPGREFGQATREETDGTTVAAYVSRTELGFLS